MYSGYDNDATYFTGEDIRRDEAVKKEIRDRRDSTHVCSTTPPKSSSQEADPHRTVHVVLPQPYTGVVPSYGIQIRHENSTLEI